ncbi:MAG: FkbM family methyltransferase [Candidatus Anammoxibacter sp.]
MIKISLPDNSLVHIPPLSKKEVRFIYKEIFVNQCYLQHGITINDGDFILDIGANVGLFTIYLVRTFKDLQVFSFEPTPPIYNCLRENVSCYENVNTYNMGFAEMDKEAEIEYMPNAPANSSVYPKEIKYQAELLSTEVKMIDIYRLDKRVFFALLFLYPFRRKIIKYFFDRMYADGEKYKCKLICLDNFISENNIENIDLLKIDVEGAEKDVFKGISDKNLDKIKQIVFEVSPQNKAWLKEIKDRLLNCGFSKINIDSMVPGSNPEKDVYPCNLFAIR